MSTIRRIARNVAKANMKKAGMVQICKGSRNVPDGKGGLFALRAAGSLTTGESGRRSEDAAADQFHGAGV